MRRARRARGLQLIVAASAALVAARVAAHDPIKSRVTWIGDIAPIVQGRCVTCHSEGGRGPMSLETYDQARKWARTIKEEVMARRMPKWHAARGYGDFTNDPSLSPFEIALFAAWADGGAPRGTDADAVAGSNAAPAATPARVSEGREVKLPCGAQPAPVGLLVAVQPEVAAERSAGIAVRFPDGRREIVAWIKNYDPKFPTIYRLRTPLDLQPGSAIVTEAEPPCALTVTVAAPR